LNWLGDWLGLDRNRFFMLWAFRVTDPLLRKIRALLPFWGPVDLSPLAALLLVYIVRSLGVFIVLGMVPRQVPF